LDLTQEALIRVLTGLGKFNIGLPFKPWLRQVTVNVTALLKLNSIVQYTVQYAVQFNCAT